jgi:hypothetical protein
MTKVRVNVNDGAMDKVFQRVANGMSEADTAFRATHEGYPEEIVRADADSALPVKLSPEDLDAYAHAVATGADFNFRLGG